MKKRNLRNYTQYVSNQDKNRVLIDPFYNLLYKMQKIYQNDLEKLESGCNCHVVSKYSEYIYLPLKIDILDDSLQKNYLLKEVGVASLATPLLHHNYTFIYYYEKNYFDFFKRINQQ